MAQPARKKYTLCSKNILIKQTSHNKQPVFLIHHIIFHIFLFGNKSHVQTQSNSDGIF